MTTENGRAGGFLSSQACPVVSAVVSACNSARFMEGCLEDLEAQTIADRIEIIVVDSASEEGEEAIVRRWQKRYPNIRYTRTERREPVYAAWNRAIRMARGTYLTNANTDDRHRTNAFERMGRVLDLRPDVALVYADVLETVAENQTFESCTPTRVLRWHDWSRDTLLTQGCFIGPQPMWRRCVHAEYGFFDERLVSSGDFEFWLRISQTHPFHHIREPLGLYLSRPDSVEHRHRDLKALEDARILSAYRRAARDGAIIRRIPGSQPANRMAGLNLA
jgi:glycosyltransferase involved in cell wall biosynthesis